MEDVKQNICENLIKLRKEKKLTQKDIADKMNYSDKAVSRWEKGDSLPDINILIKLCEFYGVEFEWLIHKHENEIPKHIKISDDNIKITIIALIAMCCFALATIIFVFNKIFYNGIVWQVFAWAVPISLCISFLLSIKWWDKKITLTLLSCTMWTLLACVFLQFLPSVNIWPIFLLGVPLQIVIYLIFKLKPEKK